MYWDPLKSTYILAPTDGNGAASATGAAVSGQQVCDNLKEKFGSLFFHFFKTQQPPPPPSVEDKETKKQKDQPQDKVKVAKKIVKDMEK